MFQETAVLLEDWINAINKIMPTHTMSLTFLTNISFWKKIITQTILGIEIFVMDVYLISDYIIGVITPLGVFLWLENIAISNYNESKLLIFSKNRRAFEKCMIITEY